MDYYIGEILTFAFNFAPENDCLECNGQQLPIQQYAAVYSLLGTAWGGDAVNNFNLPDLRGLMLAHRNTSASGSFFGILGTKTTVNMSQTTYIPVSLTLSNLPTHTHSALFTGTQATLTPSVSASVQVSANDATIPDPSGNRLAKVNDSAAGGAPNAYVPASSGGTGSLGGVSVTAQPMIYTPAGTVAISSTGTGNMYPLTIPMAMPLMAIVMQGVYPSRP